MPLKKDSSGKRWVEMHLVLPGTPDQVWHAMATGQGITAWFTPATSEQHVGGGMTFDFGQMGQGSAEITVWEPPKRFSYVERDWGEGAPDLWTDICISPRPDGTCDMTMTHWLVADGDEWNASLEDFEQGWQGFFEILRLYLGHFAGLPAVCYGAMTVVKRPTLEVWRTLAAQMHLAGADADDSVATAAGPVPVTGTVEKVMQRSNERYVILRQETGLVNVGVYGAKGNTTASLSFYTYGSVADEQVSAQQNAWQAWLDGLLKT